MSYNKRLAITQADYTRLESLLTEFLTSKESHIVGYLDQYYRRAKNESYSKTRIVFDIHGVLIRFLALDIDTRGADYDFLREGLNYLNDDTLESALKSILFDEKSPAYIGAKQES